MFEEPNPDYRSDGGSAPQKLTYAGGVAWLSANQRALAGLSAVIEVSPTCI